MAHEVKVEEDLSRMEGAYGKELIGKLKKMDVLISGMRGLGVETAKNLILAGPHSVTIHDDNLTKIADLGANFYLDESDVGKPRGAAVMRQLGELNPNVTVKHLTGALTEEVLKHYHVVAVTDETPLKELLRINTVCRAHGIKFIFGTLPGLTATLFVDFGAAHNVFDHDGVLEKTVIIDKITCDKHGVVTVDGDRHGLDDGDLVKFEGVEGMSKPLGQAVTYKWDDVIVDINQTHTIKTVPKRPNQFSIGDTSKLAAYNHGGLGTQVKVHKMFKHKPLSEQLATPAIIDSVVDFSKFGVAPQLHLARLALWEVEHLPGLHDEKEAEAVVAAAKRINDKHIAENKAVEAKNKLIREKNKSLAKEAQEAELPLAVTVDAVDEALVKKVALFAHTETTAMAALFGGVVAQEIVKQTGKYTPISQWLHFDALELLPEAKVPADAKPVGSRYDHQIALFGKAFQEKLGKVKTFVVGCGALGCEYIKAVAMTGMGCEGGEVHITDMDRIELSNLSRQFLFRRKHVGKPKSVSAGEAASEMNANLKKHLKVHEVRVEPNTENIFNDQFWDSMDFVINALDNMIARRYTDSKCVVHLKPLFESGTLGTQANNVIVLPHHTPSYSEGAVAGETQGIAKCTLQNFPALPLHCIEWAREMFDEVFASGPQKANDFIEDRETFFRKNAQEPLEELDGLLTAKRWVLLAAKADFTQCCQLAFDEFNKRYRDAIKDLTHLFPRDARNTDPETKRDLGPFWHGHKRFPTAVDFDVNVPEHVDYVYQAANIFASIFKLKEQSLEEVKKIVATFKAPEWKPSGKKIKLDTDPVEEKKEKETVSDDDTAKIAALKAELRAIDPKSLRPIAPADFEKDDDKNHHVDWITAATNLRAFNYGIAPSSRATCRLTAGRIIPAIATTTASITGFVVLEIYKYVLQRELAAHRAVTLDLAVNNFVLALLDDPKKVKADEAKLEAAYPKEGFSIWDKVIVDKGDLTVEEFCAALPTVHHGVKAASLWKAGLSDKDIADGKGQVLFTARNPFAGPYKMASMMLKREGLNEATRVTFQKQVDDYNNWEKTNNVSKRNLRELYVEKYGPLPAGRCFLLLDGTFEDDEGSSVVKIPVIKYVFNHHPHQHNHHGHGHSHSHAQAK